MSIRWKPGCYISNENYTGGSWCNEPKEKWVEYKTYKELKKNLPELIEKNKDPEGLFVLRSRRGEWGEWFERWKMVNGKPKIVKEGWN